MPSCLALLALLGNPPPPRPAVPREPAVPAGTLTSTTRDLRAEIDAWGGAAPPRSGTLLALHRQRIYRLIARERALGDAVVARLPDDVAAEARDTVRGRRELLAIPASGTLRPKIRAAEPESADRLRAYFDRAESASASAGTSWRRSISSRPASAAMRNESTAGARGPMQFMPATWRAYGLGGDIRDPARRDPRRRQLPARQRRAPLLPPALFHYNPSPHYVEAVLASPAGSGGTSAPSTPITRGRSTSAGGASPGLDRSRRVGEASADARARRGGPAPEAAIAEAMTDEQNQEDVARKLFALGGRAFERGKFGHAHAFFTRAGELADRPGIVFSRAQALRKLGGRREEAIALYEQYLATGHETRDADAKAASPSSNAGRRPRRSRRHRRRQGDLQQGRRALSRQATTATPTTSSPARARSPTAPASSSHAPRRCASSAAARPRAMALYQEYIDLGEGSRARRRQADARASADARRGALAGAADQDPASRRAGEAAGVAGAEGHARVSVLPDGAARAPDADRPGLMPPPPGPRRVDPNSAVPSTAMSRRAALSLYVLLVVIWSSTWVAIKIGLEDAPALLAPACASRSPARCCSGTPRRGGGRCRPTGCWR